MFRRPAHFCSLPIPLTVFVGGMGKGKKRHVMKTVFILKYFLLKDELVFRNVVTVTVRLFVL